MAEQMVTMTQAEFDKMLDVKFDLQDREMELLERIVKLSHAEEVLDQVASILEDEGHFVARGGKWHFSTIHGEHPHFSIVYGAAYGYRITVYAADDTILDDIDDWDDYTGIIEKDVRHILTMIIKYI